MRRRVFRTRKGCIFI